MYDYNVLQQVKESLYYYNEDQIVLTTEMMVEGKVITETRLFISLHERYVHNLKKRVLEPFLDNENFRRAIKDYDTEGFRTYDKRIRSDVEFLIKNMMTKFGYTKQGANEVCIYVIDSNLAGKFKEL
jgi:hypothetical protein